VPSGDLLLEERAHGVLKLPELTALIKVQVETAVIDAAQRENKFAGARLAPR
jgi:hypothetical protein